MSPAITQQSQIRDWPNKHYSKRPRRYVNGGFIHRSPEIDPSPPLAHQPRFLCRGRTTVSSEVLCSKAECKCARRQRVIILAGCQTEERASNHPGEPPHQQGPPPFWCPSQLYNCISQICFQLYFPTVFIKCIYSPRVIAPPTRAPPFWSISQMYFSTLSLTNIKFMKCPTSCLSPLVGWI